MKPDASIMALEVIMYKKTNQKSGDHRLIDEIGWMSVFSSVQYRDWV